MSEVDTMIIEAQHIYKYILSGKQQVPILKDISFELESGTITAIVGKSGCGKSTLLSIMSGIDAPTKGKVIFGDKNFYGMLETEQEQFRNENIGIVFQNYHLIPELTCEENIRMPLVFSKKKIQEKKIQKLIQIMKLEKKTNLFPKQLSGGEQQRTAIARALVNQPTFLLADEPTGALDSETGKHIIQFLVSCAHQLHYTILLVTHDSDVASCCDRIIHMEDGKIIKENELM